MATLFISEIDDETDVLASSLTKLGLRAIFDAISPIIKKELGEKQVLKMAGMAEGLGQIDLTDLPKAVFRQVCTAIIGIKHDELKAHIAEIKQKLTADPRYTATA